MLAGGVVAPLGAACRSQLQPGARVVHLDASLRCAASKPPARSISARYVTDQRGRRRGLVFDNLSDDDDAALQGAVPYSLEAAVPAHLHPHQHGSVQDDGSLQQREHHHDHHHSALADAAGAHPTRGDDAQHHNGGAAPQHTSSEWERNPPHASSNGSRHRGHHHDPPGSSVDDDGWGEVAGPTDWGGTSPAQAHSQHSHQQQPHHSSRQAYRAEGDRSRDRPSSPSGWTAGETSSSSSWDTNGVNGYSDAAPAAGLGSRSGSSTDSVEEDAEEGAWREWRASRRRARRQAQEGGGQGPAGPSAAQQGGPAQWGAAGDGSAYGAEGAEGAEGAPSLPIYPSDITLLSRSETDAILPVLPNGRQADYFQPRGLSERVVQLMGSLAASMLLSKSTVLAAPALLYPVWSPWVRAGLKNAELHNNQLKVAGLWRATVLEVEVLASTTFRPGSWSSPLGRQPAGIASASTTTVRLLMGDPWEGGARVQLEFPYQPKSELLQLGEQVEALVLARDAEFQAFKVIREVYAPGLGLWLAEYPFVDRTAFLDVSLQVERSRQGDAYGCQAEADPVTGETVLTVDVDVAPAPPSYGDAGDVQGGTYGAAGPEGAAWWSSAPEEGAPQGGAASGVVGEAGAGPGWEAPPAATYGWGGGAAQPEGGGAPADDWDAGWARLAANGAGAAHAGGSGDGGNGARAHAAGV